MFGRKDIALTIKNGIIPTIYLCYGIHDIHTHIEFNLNLLHSMCNLTNFYKGNSYINFHARIEFLS